MLNLQCAAKRQSIYGINTTDCSLGCITPLSEVICRKLTRGKQVLRHILIASVNHVTVVRHNPWQ